MRRQKFILKLIALSLCGYLLSGCDIPQRSSQSPSPLPTPTVDITNARKVFEVGGELTYGEVIALRHDIVGDPPDSNAFKGWEGFNAAEEAFVQNKDEFVRKLVKCRLKESIGWLAGWRNEYDYKYDNIPGLIRLYVYMNDPYATVADDYSQMFIVEAAEKDTAQMKYGQRIRFSGELALVAGNESVKHAKYQLLEDDFNPPTPTADELKDLRITLDRTMCYGTCPDYALTITGDGKVSFEGRHYTGVTGIATTTIDRSKLVELVKEFRRAGFFDLNENYTAPETDNPTYTVSIHLAGKTKQVQNYASGPRRLYILQDRIDQIIDSDQ